MPLGLKARRLMYTGMMVIFLESLRSLGMISGAGSLSYVDRLLRSVLSTQEHLEEFMTTVATPRIHHTEVHAKHFTDLTKIVAQKLTYRYGLKLLSWTTVCKIFIRKDFQRC